MRTIMVGCCLVLLAAAGEFRAHAADPSPGPTVVIAPGDVTPLRGNIRNPLGPSHPAGARTERRFTLRPRPRGGP